MIQEFYKLAATELQKLGLRKNLSRLLVLGFMLLIGYFSQRFVSSLPATNNSVQLTNRDSINMINNPLGDTDEIKCLTKEFVNPPQDWKFSGFKINGANYQSSSDKSFFTLGTYFEKVPLIFDEVTLSYKYHDYSYKSHNVIRFGSDKDYSLQLVLHENNNQLIGVGTKKFDNNEVKSILISPLTIEEEILPNSDVIVNMNSKHIGENKIRFTINLTYIPYLRPNRSQTDMFYIDTYYPNPDIDSQKIMTTLHFGTRTGGIFHPLTYKVCP